MKRLGRHAWILALLPFWILGAWNAATVPTWSEETANLPLVQPGTIDIDAPPDPARALPEAPSCATSSRRLVTSPSRRSRPALSLCVGQRAFPVLPMSYASSVFGWPIAALYPLLGTSILRLRLIWLFTAGTASLALVHALARRVVDERRATLATLLAGACSGAIYVSSLFFPYETFVWIWFATGVLLLAPVLAGERPPTTLRAAAAGLAFGLAALTNVKSLFFLVPFGVWALSEREGPRRVGWRWLVVLACALPPPALLAWFARVDPNGGFVTEAHGRLAWIEDLGRILSIFPEILNAGTFGGDTGAFFEAIATGHLARGGAAAWLVTACVAIAMIAAAARLVIFRGSPLLAGSGMLVGTFVLVSILLYRQGISANYAPVFALFGVAVAAVIFDGSTLLAKRRAWDPARHARFEAAAALFAAAILAARADDRAARQRRLHTPINVSAMVEVANVAAQHRELPVLTITMLHAFSLDTLSDERVHSVQGHAYFETCTERKDMEPCVRERWRDLLGRSGKRAFLLLAPAAERAHPHDTERLFAASIMPALRAEAERAGLAVTTIHDVRIEGERVMSLYRIEPRGA
jgi:hypothetical protein